MAGPDNYIWGKGPGTLGEDLASGLIAICIDLEFGDYEMNGRTAELRGRRGIAVNLQEQPSELLRLS